MLTQLQKDLLILQPMKIFIVSVDGKAQDKTCTSLKAACGQAAVSYSQASRGKRMFIKDESFVEIKESRVVKVKGRGKKF